MHAIVRGIVVVGTALPLLITAGGLAAADSLTGETYKDASAKVSGWGMTSIIETVVGSRLESDDCIVTSWQKSNFLDIGGQKREGAILMNLNCNNAYASATSPGNSAGSPEGRAAKALAEKNQKIADWCVLPAQANHGPCLDFWSQHEGMHEVALKKAAAEATENTKIADWCSLPAQADHGPCLDFWSKHPELREA
jgi:hypothetical protein